ncbi:MAG: hypothetical protein K0U45_05060 [Alphaproteobacteria bacterium]|nr:hypothetical protein [Alphaproteobacteria bacterium]
MNTVTRRNKFNAECEKIIAEGKIKEAILEIYIQALEKMLVGCGNSLPENHYYVFLNNKNLMVASAPIAGSDDRLEIAYSKHDTDIVLHHIVIHYTDS